MKKVNVLLVLVATVLFASSCTSTGDRVAEEMCKCIESSEVDPNKLSSIDDPAKVMELRSCVNDVKDRFEEEMKDEETQKQARISLRESCPEFAKVLGI